MTETLQSTDTSLTIPAPPPGESMAVIHLPDRADLMTAIGALREREVEHLAKIAQLEARVAELTSEKRP